MGNEMRRLKLPARSWVTILLGIACAVAGIYADMAERILLICFLMASADDMRTTLVSDIYWIVCWAGIVVELIIRCCDGAFIIDRTAYLYLLPLLFVATTWRLRGEADDLLMLTINAYALVCSRGALYVLIIYLAAHLYQFCVLLVWCKLKGLPYKEKGVNLPFVPAFTLAFALAVFLPPGIR